MIAALASMHASSYAQTKGNKKYDRVTTLYFPEFYHAGVIMVGDTQQKYECYVNEKRVSEDTIANTDNIDEICFTKRYADRSYGMGPGVSAPFLTKTVTTYNKTGPETWSSSSKDKNTVSLILARKGDIVRTDSSIVEGAEGHSRLIVRKYYKVIGQ